ncbi:hypothetical protein ATANTOWER_009965 [Ataeniobius toweri]|uniref:Uncharacterized protein n=1 Tax=Ataeniobius toweri TaxID=208326 RepID=A0ABU7C6X5_9TELE|nr:hypothetical protein [Ataeniobius toweri]
MAGSLPDSSVSWIKTLSIPCPPSNVSICILDNYMVFPVSPKQHQRKQQNELCSVSRDPESLNPWRPDCIYLLEIHLFMFLITC